MLGSQANLGSGGARSRAVVSMEAMTSSRASSSFSPAEAWEDTGEEAGSWCLAGRGMGEGVGEGDLGLDADVEGACS